MEHWSNHAGPAARYDRRTDGVHAATDGRQRRDLSEIERRSKYYYYRLFHFGPKFVLILTIAIVFDGIRNTKINKNESVFTNLAVKGAPRIFFGGKSFLNSNILHALILIWILGGLNPLPPPPGCTTAIEDDR